MSAARPLVAPPDPSTIDHFVYLRVGWQDYERLLAMRGERSVPRITYLKGVVELMSPSRYHEIDKTYFARLLEAWSEIADVPLEGYGSWTGIDKLEVYRKLGVREVWLYERGSLRFFALRVTAGEEAYVEIARSELLPDLPVDLMLACMQEPNQTAAVRALRTALKGTDSAP